jgi:hypothetical protein
VAAPTIDHDIYINMNAMRDTEEKHEAQENKAQDEISNAVIKKEQGGSD